MNPTVVRRGNAGLWLEELRVHHAAKNLLVLVPLALDEAPSGTATRSALVMFAAFTLLACGTYGLNDLHDLETDRLHSRKRLRPLARGAVTARSVLGVGIVLIVSGLGLAAPLGPGPFAALVTYLALTRLYSHAMRRVPLLDVVALTALYALRLVAGGLTVGHAVDRWAVACCFLFFFGLALMKRYAELIGDAGTQSHQRPYPATAGRSLLRAGIASGIAALAVVSVHPGIEGALRDRPAHAGLGVAVALLVCWTARMWWLASRGALRGDPVGFALTDPTGISIGLLVAAIPLAAEITAV